MTKPLTVGNESHAGASPSCVRVQGSAGSFGQWCVAKKFGVNESAEGDNDFPGATIHVPDPTSAGGWHEDAIQVWGENAWAMADLIAAAPTLLEALRQMIELHDINAAERPSFWHGAGVLEQARTAIAKATGETR